MATSQIEPTLRPYDMYLPSINSRRLQDSPLNNLEEVKAWMRRHRPGEIDNRASGNLEFLYEMNTPSPDGLLYLLQLCQSSRTAQLRKPLLEQQDLLRMPGSFWKEPQYHTSRGGWLVRAMSEELTVNCIKCSRVWTARQLETDGCNCDTSPNKKGKTIRAKRKTKKPNPKQTLGPIMRIALPEEIKKMANHDHISDTTLTLPHIQRCLEEMIGELVLRDTSANRSASQNPTIQL